MAALGSLMNIVYGILWLIIARVSLGLTFQLPLIQQKKMFHIQEKGVAHKNDRRIIYGNIEHISLEKTFDVVVAG
ncbi:hypothetical protein VU05_03820, partial [Desulfobulbus sp. F1]|nr:hypothetical protein [Desulfobulbus sp. F1]